MARYLASISVPTPFSITIRATSPLAIMPTPILKLSLNLKPYNLVDYIECQYQIDNTIYKEYSKFAVPYQRFNIGDKISIFFEACNILSSIPFF